MANSFKNEIQMGHLTNVKSFALFEWWNLKTAGAKQV